MKRKKYLILVESGDGCVDVTEFRSINAAIKRYRELMKYHPFGVRLVEVVLDYGETV